jgi:hypothetical protein
MAGMIDDVRMFNQAASFPADMIATHDGRVFAFVCAIEDAECELKTFFDVLTGFGQDANGVVYQFEEIAAFESGILGEIVIVSD